MSTDAADVGSTGISDAVYEVVRRFEERIAGGPPKGCARAHSQHPCFQGLHGTEKK